MLLNGDVAPAEKKRTWEKGKVISKKKMCPREKKRHIKKSLSMVGSKTHKIKLDSEEKLGSKVSNADSIVRPASGLSNTSSEVESGFGNGEAEKLGNELIVIICGSLIGLFCISLCLRTSSEMVNAMILKLLNIHFSVDFKTIS